MKFGIMLHKNTQNLGDDIQAYATSLLLPEISYFLDREQLDTFKTDDGEPAAVVMAAWYMWHKWNWPPSKYIVPLFVGMHYTDNQLANQDGSPIKTAFLTGLAKDYMNACEGGIGCRDGFTKKTFERLGINCYFSGCITLTLPQQPKIKPEREYVVSVDIVPEAEARVDELLKGTGIEHRRVTHRKDYRNSEKTFEERVEYVKEILTIYQNAKCVVTKRLHCALPCLAMGVPVLLLNNENNGIRFDPYYDWLHYCRREQFISGEFDYDITDPPPNKDCHIPYREKLIADIKAFAEKYKDVHGTPEQLCPLNYDEAALIRWRHDRMKTALDQWFEVNRTRIHEVRKVRRQLAKTEAKLEAAKKSVSAEKEKASQLAADNKRLAEENRQLAAENRHLKKVVNCRTVKASIAARNAFLPKNKRIDTELSAKKEDSKK